MKKAISAAMLLAMTLWTGAAAAPLEIYIDADYSINQASAASIEHGLRTALKQVGYRLGGEEVVVVPMDNRGNVKRSRRTMELFAASDAALAMFGGLHSPPYLTHRSFINENGILTLLAWSAAGPITRPDPPEENWIFRLSVDDNHSGEFLVREAMDRDGCNSLSLILLDTGWGRANLETLTAALEARGSAPRAVAFFPATLGKAAAGTLAREIAAAGADCAVMLANGANGALIVNALHERMQWLKVYSHWGITGGGFTQSVPARVRANLGLEVLQTCGLRREREGSAVLAAALEAADGAPTRLADLDAPTGFVHGYDLGRVLIAAAEQASGTAGWKGRIGAKRVALRQALQRLESPVSGILKTYDPPFRPYSAADPDAHEALGVNDLCMAVFDANGALENAH